MQQVLGYSALKTGVAWLATSLTALALAGPAQILVTRVSAKLVMAAGMTLVAAGILWATQVPAHGHYWANLAGPLFVAGGAIFAFITTSIGALAGVTEHDAGIASGLLNTSQQIGGRSGSPSPPPWRRPTPAYCSARATPRPPRSPAGSSGRSGSPGSPR